MKVVLSRKGFDSSYGKMPSPIMPDGTLLSLPIPTNVLDRKKYSELYYGNESYLDIIRQLKPNTPLSQDSHCHLDPDLIENATKRDTQWYPLFGQCNQSQSHLKKNGVIENDLFLFWGWFRQSEFHEGRLRFCRNAPDLHVIFGYMEIKELHTDGRIPERLAYHPHGQLSLPSNCIYEGDRSMSGIMKFDDRLVLTKKGMSRSKWELPIFFRDAEISYHNAASFRDGYFQSANRGQEFVIGEKTEVSNWANQLISTCALH
jgi:hypothetical protein